MMMNFAEVHGCYSVPDETSIAAAECRGEAECCDDNVTDGKKWQCAMASLCAVAAITIIHVSPKDVDCEGIQTIVR